MSLLSWILGPSAGIVYQGLPPRDPTLAAQLSSSEKATAGVQVNETTALGNTAIWAGVNVISSSFAMLDVILNRHRGDGKKERARAHPAYPLLLRRPCPDCSPFAFKQTIQAHALLRGNGYALIERDGYGQPLALYPLDPSRVRPDRDEDGLIYYKVDNRDGKLPVPVPALDMLHIAGLGYDGVCGYSVVQMLRDAIGLGMAAERHGAAFLGNGSRPAGFLSTPGKLDNVAAKTYREQWERMHQGPQNAGRVAVLGSGMTWEQTGITPEDAQLLQTRQFQVIEVARILNLPPHFLRDLMRATFSNIEVQGIEYVTYTLGPWMTRWEQEIAFKLLRPDEQEEYFVEHDADRLQRGDKESRYRAYATGRQWGWLSANDVLRAEGEETIEDGDIYLVPGNMVPADQAGQQMQPAAPPAKGDKAPPDAALVSGHRASIVARAEHLVQRESHSARNAAARPREYLQWLDSWYPEHEGIIREALTPLAEVSAALFGGSATERVRLAAREHVERSRAELLAVYDSASRKAFADQISQLCDRWEADRPGALADLLTRAL